MTYCPVNGCIKKDLVGAHVQRGGINTDQNWYIYPLCSDHNQSSKELDVSDTYKLVSANKKETCEDQRSQGMRATTTEGRRF